MENTMQNIKTMTTAAINLRMQELDSREYDLTEAQSAEWAALFDERRIRHLADGQAAALAFMREQANQRTLYPEGY
jgi:hypothetical protein